MYMYFGYTPATLDEIICVKVDANGSFYIV